MTQGPLAREAQWAWCKGVKEEVSDFPYDLYQSHAPGGRDGAGALIRESGLGPPLFLAASAVDVENFALIAELLGMVADGRRDVRIPRQIDPQCCVVAMLFLCDCRDVAGRFV